MTEPGKSAALEFLSRLRESDQATTRLVQQGAARRRAVQRRAGGPSGPDNHSGSGTPRRNPGPSGPSGGSAGSAQAYARQLLQQRGLGDDANFQALVNLWNKESNWNPTALNKSSGAYGIAQMMPMHGRREGAKAQIDWGVDYIMRRYGSPSAAWQHSQRTDWY